MTDIINTSDDRIMYMISQMREAAEEDRRLNQAGQAAVNKLGLLKLVIKQLNKHDLQNAFIDCGIVSSILQHTSDSEHVFFSTLLYIFTIVLQSLC